VYLDALMVKMRQDGKVDNRAVYTAIGINMDGEKSVAFGNRFWALPQIPCSFNGSEVPKQNPI
jgi:hypothetical protein